MDRGTRWLVGIGIIAIIIAVLAWQIPKGSSGATPRTSASSKPSSRAHGLSLVSPSVSPSAKPSSQGYAYSTPQPGPGCDTNGAMWTEDDVQFNNGCDVEAKVQSQYGFLNLTLPSGRAFSQNNTVSITGSLGNGGDGCDSACLGLVEDGSGEGYLAAYCNNGDWYIYSTSGEVIGHRIKTGSISMGINGTTYQMILALKGRTLSLTFNNVDASGDFKVASIAITPFAPAQVGIGYEYGYYQVPAPAKSFIYTEQ
jgi:hypothetical protein